MCDRYWDWAEPRVAQEGLPPVLYEDKLTITVAGGKTMTVNNPFSYYSYQTGIPSDFENESTVVRSKSVYSYCWRYLLSLFVGQ